MKKALIIGISGQDGSYLAKYLLDKGYKVFGTSRDSMVSQFVGLKFLNVFDKVKLYSMSIIDFRSVMQTILEIHPDEIYNLAGQTSVGLSFIQPVETLESISIGTLNILEVIRFHKLPIKFYSASSSECFGDTGNKPADELTLFKPRSPYAIAKATSFWQVANYREAYGLFACSGILFNHESILRSNRFVTKKIINTVCQIAHKKMDNLIIGNIEIARDWGWAPEYVEAMSLMLQNNSPDDFVIATGKTITLEKFIEIAFSYFSLDYKKHISVDKSLLRPTDIKYSSGDASKAKKILGWQPKIYVEDVIKKMIESELEMNYNEKK